MPFLSQGEIVDLVCMRTLQDVANEPVSSDLDRLLLQLQCGHTFTVETLDGIVGIESTYQRSNDQWKEPIPPSQSTTPPVCPTCRRSFHVRRYNRAIKQAHLDMSQRAYDIKVSKTLHSIQTQLQNHLSMSDDAQRVQLADDVEKLILKTQQNASWRQTADARLKAATQPNVYTHLDIFDKDVVAVYDLSSGGAQMWHRLGKGLFGVLRRATEQMLQAGPFQRVYETQFTKVRLDVRFGSYAPLTIDCSASFTAPKKGRIRIASKLTASRRCCAVNLVDRVRWCSCSSSA